MSFRRYKNVFIVTMWGYHVLLRTFTSRFISMRWKLENESVTSLSKGFYNNFNTYHTTLVHVRACVTGAVRREAGSRGGRLWQPAEHRHRLCVWGHHDVRIRRRWLVKFIAVISTTCSMLSCVLSSHSHCLNLRLDVVGHITLRARPDSSAAVTAVTPSHVSIGHALLVSSR